MKFRRSPNLCDAVDIFDREKCTRELEMVEALKGAAGPGYSEDVFFKKLFSLDVWKEAFPSLQRAYFIVISPL